MPSSTPSEHIAHHRVRKALIAIIVTPVALLFALVFVSFTVDILARSERISRGDYSLPETLAPQQVPETYVDETKALIEGNNNYSFGTENPQVTIVEFSDFACPFCLASFPALREISVKYQDKVKIIFRDWPGHEFSINLALSAYCAGEQGKFWEMHDKLFQNQSETFGSDKNQLAILAQQLGIYNQQFQTCFDSQKYLPHIRDNFADAQQLNVQGTPTWFINGKKVEGQLSATDLENLIRPYIQ